jgi:hypothetical protein
MRLTTTLVLTFALAGCTPPRASTSDDLGGWTLPDGHVQQGCTGTGDCDDGNRCTVDSCGFDQRCSYAPVDCKSLNGTCTVGVCDPGDGKCESAPAAEGSACETFSQDPGHCGAGVCIPSPQCAMTGAAITCSTTGTTRTGATSGASALDTYACATGLTGPEIGYALRTTTDRTITLKLASAVDLDLIVLEGTVCVAGATCTAAAATAGTGDETLTFEAHADREYVVVVEGRAGVEGSFTLTATCAGCEPVAPLACNQTLSGDTTSAKATDGLHSYGCAPSLAGPEEAFTLTATDDTEYELKLSGLSQDLDLIVLADTQGACNPGSCRGSGQQTGTQAEALSLSAVSGQLHHVVVDSKSAGGAYQLEVACAPSCRSNNTLSCSAPSDFRRNDDPTRGKSRIERWGACATGMTGPEVVYQFTPSQTAEYTFSLSGLTADLDLIVMEGTSTQCSPLGACVASSLTPGTASETVKLQAQSGKRYWIAVDGKAGAVSGYALTVRSPSCTASCLQSANTLGCTYLEDRRRSDDTTRGKSAIDGWACDANTTGPEVVYPFKPPVDGTYTVTLDGLAADLDLVVVANSSAFACDPAAACVASSVAAGTTGESVTFAAEAAKSYYIAVDGKAGAVSPYRIRIAGASCPAPTCQNGNRALSCSSVVVSNASDARGATNAVDTWSCGGGLTGPEFAHLFTPTGAGPFTVELIGLKKNLDLMVIEAGSATACSQTGTCMGVSRATEATSEKVTFTADPAKKYWVVVDGNDGAYSPYTVAITDGCP